MRRIIVTEAVCLHTVPVRESSRLVTLFTPDHGRIVCLAKGARGPQSRFGAALDRCAVARVIYYWRETRATYALTDATLVRSAAALTLTPGKFLAAEQMTEFVLRATPLHDPHPQLHRLLLTYLATLEKAQAGFEVLVSSFLLKAASFLGFRPELRRCLTCRRDMTTTGDTTQTPVVSDRVPNETLFDPARGGIICSHCAGQDMVEIPDVSERTLVARHLASGELSKLQRLLYSPSSDLVGLTDASDNLNLVLRFLAHHFDPLLLNSFNWPAGF